jgi:hypothetical protein
MANEPQRRRTIDPSVADILSDGTRRQSELHLPLRERKKKARERKKIRERKERRVTYDLPPALRQRISETADEQGVPASQLATLLLRFGLKALDSGEIDLANHPRKPSKSPRYDWNLVIEGEE